MASKIKFYHIPKTGGRFFYTSTLNLIKYDIVFNDLDPSQYMEFPGHYFFNDIENFFSISIIRNPVDRLISHYLHIYENHLDQEDSVEKILFFSTLENPNCGLINYQTKVISYSGSDPILSLEEQNLPIQANSDSLLIAKNRLSNIDIVYKTENLNLSTVMQARQRLYDAIEIVPSDKYFNLEITGNRFENAKSQYFKSLMSAQEISKIEESVQLDMELYESVGN